MNQRASQAELLGASQARVAQVIDPVDWEHFCAEYWDRKPLYLADGSDRFAPLADAATLRRLVESGTPWQYRRLPEMYIDSGFVPHEDLVHEYVDMDGRVARAPRLDRVRQLLLNGATANCFGQEAHFPELMALKLAFAQTFSGRGRDQPVLFAEGPPRPRAALRLRRDLRAADLRPQALVRLRPAARQPDRRLRRSGGL